MRCSSRVYLTRLLPAGLHGGDQPDTQLQQASGSADGGEKGAYAGTEIQKGRFHSVDANSTALDEPLRPHWSLVASLPPTSAQGEEPCARIGPHDDAHADDDDLFSTCGLHVQTHWGQAIGSRGGNYASTPLSEICVIAFQLARDTA